MGIKLNGGIFMTKKYQKYISFVLPEQLDTNLRSYCIKEDISVGKAVRKALEYFLEQNSLDNSNRV